MFCSCFLLCCLFLCGVVWRQVCLIPLHVSAQYGKVEVAKSLIQAKADVNILDKGRYNPLDRTLARKERNKKMEKLLTDAGAKSK